MQYLSFVDGLRAISVAAVVAYHLSPNFAPNGFLGVDIFFVISGFVVSYSIGKLRAASFGRFVLDFYSRRFVRILPALLFCLIVTSVLAFLFIPEVNLGRSIAETGKWAFVGLSNVYLAQGVDYFATTTEFNPFTHTWSLGVDEQFYLAFPFLFFLWVGKRSKYCSICTIASLALLSFCTWIYLIREASLSAFYMIHARFWQLAAGVLCFQIISGIRPGGEAKGNATTAAGGVSIAMIAAAIFLTLPAAYSGISNVLAVAGAICLICSMWWADTVPRCFRALTSAPLRLLGKTSYSLYLWHWPIFVLARWTYGLETAWQMGISLAIAVCAALFSYLFIETPFRRSDRIRRAPRYTIVFVGIGAIGLSITLFLAAKNNKKHISQSVVMEHQRDWIPQDGAVRFADIPDCTIADASTAAYWRYERSDCNKPPSNRHLFMVGDSHAWSYVPLIKRIVLLTGMPVSYVRNGGCSFVSLRLGEDERCKAMTDQAVEAVLADARPGDIVFLPSLRLPRLSEQFARFDDTAAWDSMHSEAGKADRSKATRMAVEALSPLARKGVHIVFEAPKPIFRSPSFRCSDWFNRRNPSCRDGLSIEKSYILALRRPVLEAFNLIASELENVSVWDPLPTLCPQEHCEVVQDGRPLFFDGDHVSNYSSELLTSDLAGFLTAIPE